MEKTEKRWSFIVNTIYFLIFAAAFYLFMKYAFWTLFPFMVSFVVAAALQRPLRFFTRSEKAPKGVISAVLSLLVFAVIITLLAVLGARIVSSIKDLIKYFTDRCSNIAEAFEIVKNGYMKLEIAQKLPDSVNSSIIGFIDTISGYFVNGDIVDTVTQNFSKLASPISSVVVTVPNVLAAFIICIVATCFMTVGYGDMKAFILRQFKDDRRDKAIRTKHILVSSVGKMLRAYGLIILITTFELTVGLSLLKLIGIYEGSHILLISLLIALIDIVPVLGTGTVVIPWSIYSFITGNIGMGIGLLIIYAVISVIRQVIEPKLVAGQVGISPIVTIIAMYVGIKLFGAIGIFILPFFVIIIKLLNDEGIIHLFTSNPEDIEKCRQMNEQAENEKKKPVGQDSEKAEKSETSKKGGKGGLNFKSFFSKKAEDEKSEEAEKVKKTESGEKNENQ